MEGALRSHIGAEKYVYTCFFHVSTSFLFFILCVHVFLGRKRYECIYLLNSFAYTPYCSSFKGFAEKISLSVQLYRIYFFLGENSNIIHFVNSSEGKMRESCPPLSQVLLEVKQELWLRYASLQPIEESSGEDISRVVYGKTQRRTPKSSEAFKCTKYGRSSYSHNSNWEKLPSIVLDALDEEDWNSIIYPVSELKPYLNCLLLTSSTKSGESEETKEYDKAVGGQSSHLSILESYVQCRCAELPMRLQTEALVLRRHEEARRQFMGQLILLSQIKAYWIPGIPPERSGLNDHKLATEYSSGSSCHMQRCQKRIPELEQKIISEVMAKRKCSQRMTLMSAVAYALVNRLDELEESASKNESTHRQ